MDWRNMWSRWGCVTQIGGGVAVGGRCSLGAPKKAYGPGSRGYGTRQRILPRYGYLIPARVNTHGITDDPMIVLDAMHLKVVLRVHGELYEHHRRKEGRSIYSSL